MFWMNAGTFTVKPYNIEWRLPPNWWAEKILFPLPTKIVSSEKTEYIYRDSLTLFTRLYSPNESGNEVAYLDLRWLECTSQICMWRDTTISFKFDVVGPNAFPRLDTIPNLAFTNIRVGGFSDSTTDRRASHISWYEKVMSPDSLSVTDFYPSYSENARISVQMIGDRAYVDVNLIDVQLGIYGIVGRIIFINDQPYWYNEPMLWPPDSAG
jgi:hypothetical protein